MYKAYRLFYMYKAFSCFKNNSVQDGSSRKGWHFTNIGLQSSWHTNRIIIWYLNTQNNYATSHIRILLLYMIEPQYILILYLAIQSYGAAQL